MESNNNCGIQVALGVVESAFDAGVGYLTADLLIKSMSPVAGAIFGGVSGGVNCILHPIFNLIFKDSTIEKIVQFVLELFLSLGAGFLMVSLSGFQITVAGTLILGGVMMVTSLIAAFAFAGCILTAANNHRAAYNQ